MHAAERMRTATESLDGSARVGLSERQRIEVLLKAEGPRVLGYFIRQVANSDDAADLLGETMLVTWRRRAAVPADPVEARMWLFGVAKRTMSTWRRAAGRRSALTEKLRDELVASNSGSNHVLAGDAVRKPLDDELGHAIGQLRSIDRDIIALVHWEGFSLAETAVLLGQRPGTVRSRYQRARERLKKALDASGDDE